MCCKQLEVCPSLSASGSSWQGFGNQQLKLMRIWIRIQIADPDLDPGGQK
jgi:hypothetical protein